MGPPELIGIAEARERVLRAVRALPAESVELAGALGRVLAEDVESPTDLPPFDSSAMDGFAVPAGAGGELPVVGESRAGAPAARTLGPGEAMRISTGAQLPAGAVAVVPVERVELVDGRVRLERPPAGTNVRRAGEDVRAGEHVVARGTPLGPPELALLAAVGRGELLCARRPRVAVLATGDELVEPGSPLGPGQIRNSNAVAIVAQAERAGAQVVRRALVPDELEATTAALRDALGAADVVCVSGGVSVGPHDHVRPALEALGVEQDFWGVRLKPGKPTWFGVAEADSPQAGVPPSRRLVFGLPGNPVSAMVTFHLFVRPALRALAGAPAEETRTTATLDVPVRRSPAREQVIRCRLAAAGDGWHVEPTKEQGSHVLSSMLGAGAFALIPAGEGELSAGERVEVELLDWR